jgi:uncharacterized membrane protein
MQSMQAGALITMPASRNPPTVPASPTRWTRWSLCLLSLLGGGVAAYLLFLSLAHRNLPAGCGQGSGCDEVLHSRWSQVFGVPVSGPAVAVYAMVLLTALFLRPGNSFLQKQKAWSVLILLAAVLAGSAIWFVVLQLAVIKAICPWCLGEHGLGLLVAAIILSSAPVGRTRSPVNDVEASPLLSIGRVLASGAVGVALVGGLALAQTLVAYHPPQVQRLPEGQNADTGPGPNRMISVLNGRLTFAPHEVPVLGSADAPKLLVVLFDYCCPHCRATHGYLLNGLAAREDELAVLLLPTPLNSKCNPYWEQTEERFAHACELARLALAVWRVDRAAFVRFDAWLFEPEKPRDPAEARRHAAELVPAGALDRALQDPWIDRQIEQNVAAYHNSQAERVPVILSPGMRAIVGRPESEEQLFQLLEKELKLRPSGR